MRAVPLLLIAACGGGTNTAGPDATDCANDPRAEQFVAGMMKTGMATGMQFTIVSSDPAPPARPNNDWVIKIADSTGAALDGATVSVKPFMPDHNHGTGIVPTITPVSGMPGTYDANPINTFMPGIWEITITARPAGGGATDTDSAKFTFCINN
jgi:hypothetical protein